jgi:uncharacterized damage-inducible protein DinB
MATSDPLRQQLVRLLEKSEAHASTEEAVAGLAPNLQGKRPAGLPHSPWELLEHIRITQHDILDFCVNPNYKELSWPTDYWPPSPTPPKPDAWENSVKQLRADLAALCALAEDPAVDLFARIPHGDGQTYLRELLVVADHNSYHVGQLILVRRLLGAWPPAK